MIKTLILNILLTLSNSFKDTSNPFTIEWTANWTQHLHCKLLYFRICTSIRSLPLCWRFGFKCMAKSLPNFSFFWNFQVGNQFLTLFQIKNHPIQTFIHHFYNFIINSVFISIMQDEVKKIASSLQWPMYVFIPFFIDNFSYRFVAKKEWNELDLKIKK